MCYKGRGRPKGTSCPFHSFRVFHGAAATLPGLHGLGSDAWHVLGFAARERLRYELRAAHATAGPPVCEVTVASL